MNTAVAEAPTATTLPAIGAPFEGGFFTGVIVVNGQRRALITAGAEGELKGKWNESLATVSGATSRTDGMANTKAMAEAGSELAQQALALSIGGHADWYIPSKDEQELQHRVFKPTTRKNWDDRDNGINPSSLPVGEAYTANYPLQTTVENFRAGGPDAFEPDWYWSSTQHAVLPGTAWLQGFGNGGQGCYHESYAGRARAVRSEPI